MQRMLLPLAALGAAAAVASCAPIDKEPISYAGIDQSRQCFFISSINGYSDAPDGPNGEERLIVSTGPNDDWLFQVWGPCHELDFAEQIAFDPRTRSSICTGNTETLLVPTSISSQPDRCQVRLLGKVTDAALLGGNSD